MAGNYGRWSQAAEQRLHTSAYTDTEPRTKNTFAVLTLSPHGPHVRAALSGSTTSCGRSAVCQVLPPLLPVPDAVAGEHVVLYGACAHSHPVTCFVSSSSNDGMRHRREDRLDMSLPTNPQELPSLRFPSSF